MARQIETERSDMDMDRQEQSGTPGAQEYGSAPAPYTEGNATTEGLESEGGAKVREYAQQGREVASEYASKAQEKATEYAQVAQEKAEVGKERAAEGMERLAGQLRERTGEEGAAAAAGQKVADSMEKTAYYLREHEVTEIWGDLEAYVREHPMQAMAGAVFAGFLLGRMMR
jgi:hypothetical protein